AQHPRARRADPRDPLRGEPAQPAPPGARPRAPRRRGDLPGLAQRAPRRARRDRRPPTGAKARPPRRRPPERQRAARPPPPPARPWGGRAADQRKDSLGPAAPPLRIECYDMSHLQGSDYVGSMVVMEDGLPKRSDYRRFKVTSVAGNDDYGAMREVLTRRLR